MHNHETVFKANKEYYNIAAQNYFKNESYAYTPEIKDNVKKLLKIAADHAPQKSLFLDYGCGSGFLSSIVAEHYIMEGGLGVDASESQIKLYNANLAGTNFKAEVGDIKCMRFGNNTFDMAGGYSVLHHLFNYYEVINEITRVLKPGGVLYIDFEPNHLFKILFKLPIAIRRLFFDQSPVEGNLENVAEYHNNYQPGICRKNLTTFLSRDYKIIEMGHRIPATECMDILKKLSQLSFIFSPCFYVLAKKK